MRTPLGAAAAFILSLVATAHCPAHEGDFVISRDNAQPPRLHLNGLSNLLDGSDCIDLLPGDAHLTGYWFNDAPGFSTMKRDGDIRGRHRLLPGHRIALRLVRADPGFGLLEPSTWRPVLSAAGDTYPFFLNPQGDFSIQMIPRCNHPRRTSADFQLVDLAGLHADSEPFRLCFAADVPLEITRSSDRLLRSAPLNRFRALAALSYPILLESTHPPNAVPGDLHGHAHSAVRPLVPPATFQTAVAELRARLHEMDGWITLKKYNQLPGDVDLVAKLIAALPSLVVSPISGVPPSGRELLTDLSARALPICTAMRFSASMGDDIPVREDWEELSKFLVACDQYIPARFICPMRCEGEKTSDMPGKCPVCGMKLVDTRAHQDHQPKHGGTFFMAPDGRHHLEGTISEGGEFRLYFYNEFTRPIPAEPFKVRALSGTTPAIAPLELSLAPNSEYQFARIDKKRSPLRIKLFIDFGDDAGPQPFDFDFPP